jgi:DNA gyrase subunit A
MIEAERPDLSQVAAEIKAYIEALEAENARLNADQQRLRISRTAPVTSEPPTTMNVVTISHDGQAKRTPRHLYSRQGRGGMGVFDLETGSEDHATLLTVVEEQQHILLFSNFGRAFRLPANALAESEVRDKGISLGQLLPFRPHERLIAALPGDGGEYVVLVSQRGWVRRVHHNYLGRSLIPGMSFHNVQEGGYLTRACWTPGDGELLMLSREGKGIRFAERQVPARGCLGMRVHVEDAVVAVAAVYADSGVFLLGKDGKGTIRLMSGFSANKAPGAGGKIVMKTDNLVGAVSVSQDDDIFVISHLNKIIRFMADEVPAKTGVVQGVNCITLRGDEAAAVTCSSVDQSL